MAERIKEEEPSKSQDDCYEKLTIEDEFVALSASFFGNKDVRMLWQDSNFAASKALWIDCGEFDFSELEIEDDSDKAKKKKKIFSLDDSDVDMGELFGSEDSDY